MDRTRSNLLAKIFFITFITFIIVISLVQINTIITGKEEHERNNVINDLNNIELVANLDAFQIKEQENWDKAFINAINSGAKRLILSEGKTYNISTTIDIPSEIEIEGNNARILYDSSSDIFSISDKSNIVIKNIWFNSPTGGIISIWQSNNVNIENCDFTGSSSNHIRIMGTSSYIRILDNRFEGASDTQLIMYDKLSNIEISNNKFFKGLGNSITKATNSEAKISESFIINKNIFYDSGRMSIELNNIDNIEITDNKFYKSTDMAISLPGCKNLLIKDNLISNCVTHAIEIGGSLAQITKNVTISDNIFSNITLANNPIILNTTTTNIEDVIIENNEFNNCISSINGENYNINMFGDKKHINIKILNNNFNNSNGILVKGENHLIENNKFIFNSESNNLSIYIAGENNSFKNNKIIYSDNSSIGSEAIRIGESSNLNIIGNDIIGNGKRNYGITNDNAVSTNNNVEKNKIEGINISGFKFDSNISFKYFKDNEVDK